MKEQYLVMVYHGRSWMFLDNTPDFQTKNEAVYWCWWNYRRDIYEKNRNIRVINSKDREAFIASYERGTRLAS